MPEFKRKLEEEKETEEDSSNSRGFAQGLRPERIIGATQSSGELMFLMKWEGNPCKDEDVASHKGDHTPKATKQPQPPMSRAVDPSAKDSSASDLEAQEPDDAITYTPAEAETTDGAFCLPCALFVEEKREHLGLLVNKPFRKWSKKKDTINPHAECLYHTRAMQVADGLIHSIETLQSTIPALSDARVKENIGRNRHCEMCHRSCAVMQQTMHRVTQEQGIPQERRKSQQFLCPHETDENHNPILRAHLDSPILKNATYVSTKIQNEVINIMDKDMILVQIVSEVNSAVYYSVLADETTSHNKEQLSLCIRFVDKCKDIKEEFVRFSGLHRTTGYHIAQEMKSVLAEIGLDISNMRGQGYDGAAAMSSERIGVQKLIRDDAPKAVYMHCNGHCLNLVIGHACSNTDVRNMIDKLKAVCLYFKYSPKRQGLLEHIITKNAPGSKRKPLLNLCKTRWAERQEAYTHVNDSYPHLVTAFEKIAHRLHSDILDDDILLFRAAWDAKSKQDAVSILASITSFGFIMTFNVVYYSLAHLEVITVKLQKSALDIFKAHEFEMVQEFTDYFRMRRNTVDDAMKDMFTTSMQMAGKVDVVPSMPRINAWQINRGNTPAESVDEYYKQNLLIPFTDHIVTKLEAQFSGLQTTASKLLGLVPTLLVENIDISEVVDMYEDDLPTPHLVATELDRWKHKFTNVADKPISLAQALKNL
ncbi:PREDICTED: 52 kDa repressor of the inhibitor of the protein kinase-like [Priapulus caudatus]|uniref:52 kDa repressor of the inhibitor of the protein kinase-like n=1 Tax=Priapulus caudatus TaxID=37621 RepID=A0ABM1EPD6_PRICU|nr:PREDICTED: 52 kDa repressor of the inhibitor of the protein kinase-like [Priapulus caudatus]